jgi:hypothetical protein
MNYNDEKIDIKLPTVAQMRSHKRRLKIALLEYHERRKFNSSFVQFIINKIKKMSLGKKSTALATMLIFSTIIGAGIFGPTVSDVAQAEAVSTINRAYGRIQNLTDEQKAEMEARFQERVQIMGDRPECPINNNGTATSTDRVIGGCDHPEGFMPGHNGKYMGFGQMTDEEREKIQQEMKVSLEESLKEAMVAKDLKIVSADEMPKPGFFGKAGRAFGFEMKKKIKDFENLPEEIKQKVEEHRELMDQFREQPVKFLMYTDSEGRSVTLGVDENDTPIVKFVRPQGGECPGGENCTPPPAEGRGFMRMMFNSNSDTQTEQAE